MEVHVKSGLLELAAVAFERSRKGVASAPCMLRSRVETMEGSVYVVLKSVEGLLLAVYRLGGDRGILRRLKRWPAALPGAHQS
jgi:hypothetical protein